MVTQQSDYKDEIILFEIGFFLDYSDSFCVNVHVLSAVKFAFVTVKRQFVTTG